MRYRIIGDNLQLVVIELDPGERVYAEAGALNHMSANVRMETKVREGALKGLKRILMRETFFMTEFEPAGGHGIIAFGGNVPGKIMPIEIAPERSFIVQKDAFLVAQESVDLDIAFTKRLGPAIFGGEGFILERLSGQGIAFIHACGDFIEYDLRTDQVMKVDTGQIVGFDATVDYDITLVGGIKSMLFGGEGIFLATLRGPGRVILQSMSLANLAAALRPYFPSQTSGFRMRIPF